MSVTNRNERNRGSIASLVTTLISVGLALALVANRQAIIDHISAWQYQPSATIQSFATRAGLNDNGKFYFFASQPSLDDRQTFNQHCPSSDVQTAILGCYVSDRIYIYNVPGDQLTGIRTVTATHEMLHAAYERLSAPERQHIDSLVEAEYSQLKNDKKLASRMAFYAKTEPGERDNELHSVIGTEISTVNPELEKYYQRYFSDRQKVVTLHTAYESVFAKLQARGDQLNRQLDALQASINQDSKAYNAEVAQLNADIRDFNARADKGGFKSQSSFDQERAQLVSRASQLDALRAKINSNVATFNQLQKELKSIASQSDELNKSINSNLAPAPSL